MEVHVDVKEFIKGVQIALLASKGGSHDIGVRALNGRVEVLGTNGHMASCYRISSSANFTESIALRSADAKTFLKRYEKGASTNVVIDFTAGTVGGDSLATSNHFPFLQIDELLVRPSATPGAHVGIGVEYMADISKMFKISGAKAMRLDFTGYKNAMKITDTMNPNGALTVIFMPVETLPAPVKEEERITLEGRLNGFSRGVTDYSRIGTNSANITRQIMQEAALLREILSATIEAVNEKAAIVSAAFKNSLEG